MEHNNYGTKRFIQHENTSINVNTRVAKMGNSNLTLKDTDKLELSFKNNKLHVLATNKYAVDTIIAGFTSLALSSTLPITFPKSKKIVPISIGLDILGLLTVSTGYYLKYGYKPSFGKDI
jgi:hypothetical protein